MYSRRKWAGVLFSAPLMLGFFLFYVLPFGQIVWDSFSAGAGKNLTFVGLENYITLLHGNTFRLALINSLAFLGAGLPTILVLSYALALFFEKYAQHFALVRSILLLPYVMPVVGTVLLVDLLFSREGLLNGALMALGFPIADWLQSPTAFWVMLLLYLWKSSGYSIVLLLAGLMAIPATQYDVAQVEGASQWQVFRFITMPQMWYALFIAFVFSLLNAFQSFREIFLVGGEHPHPSVYMLQHFIHNSFSNLSYRQLSVASMLLFLLVTLVLGSLYLWVRKKEATRW